MNLVFRDGVTHEADDVLVRFRTREQSGVLMTSVHDRSADKMDVALEGGRVKVTLQLGSAKKTVYVGQSLNDDIYHSIVIRRRGRKIRAIVDDDEPVIGKKKRNYRLVRLTDHSMRICLGISIFSKSGQLGCM
jgi:hypothetical protein